MQAVLGALILGFHLPNHGTSIISRSRVVCGLSLPTISWGVRVTWKKTDAEQLTEALQKYANGTVSLYDSNVYYMAEAHGHPVAFLGCSNITHNNHPIMDMLCVNNIAMKHLKVNRRIWSEFYATFGYVPCLDAHTILLETTPGN